MSLEVTKCSSELPLVENPQLGLVVCRVQTTSDARVKRKWVVESAPLESDSAGWSLSSVGFRLLICKMGYWYYLTHKGSGGVTSARSSDPGAGHCASCWFHC